MLKGDPKESKGIIEKKYPQANARDDIPGPTLLGRVSDSLTLNH